MPSFELVVESDYKETFRTSKVVGMFDVPLESKITKKWNVDIPIEDMDWNIGVIVGASGSGKTTIGKNLYKGKYFHTGFKWSKDKSFIDDFSEDFQVKEIVEALSKVGFSSPPSWLLPYSNLSNGQKFRVEIARCVLENDITIFDEFTSVVDRQVAKIGCAAVQKFIRKRNKQFIALSCHYDILEWLEPDWVYDVSSGEFKDTRGRLRRPEIKAEIYECDRKAWQLFKGHHYLTADISNGCRAFVMLVDDIPVAFTAIIHFPYKGAKRCKREHRTVVLPDYQGIGLGNILSDTVGDIVLSEGFKYFSTTGHPAMIGYRKRSSKWKMNRKPGYSAKQSMSDLARSKSQSANRLTASFEYIGDKK